MMMFEISDISVKLLDMQNQEDLSIIQERLVAWYSNKSLNEIQKKDMLKLIQALFRIQAYTETQKTLSKKSVMELSYQNTIFEKELTRAKQDSLKIESLERELKYFRDEQPY